MPVAELAKRLPDNVPGDFYVDETCIDCDACRIFAPTVFSDTGDQSTVFHQPATDDELLAAQKALISCPTASIGSITKHDMHLALASLPELIDGDVYRCGYASEASFGAISYLVRRPQGNILIDSPRFSGPLVRTSRRWAALRGCCSRIRTTSPITPASRPVLAVSASCIATTSTRARRRLSGSPPDAIRSISAAGC